MDTNLNPGSLVEEGRTEAPPDDIPVGAAGAEGDLVLLHNLLQLLADFAHLPHRLYVDEVA